MVVGQIAVAVVPLSPLQGAQVLVADEQAGSAGVLQSAPVTHAPHVPAARPVVTHVASDALRQGAVAVLPKSPLHATHVSFAPIVEHAEVTPVQLPCSVALQGPHVFFAVSQTAPMPQSASRTHPPHWLAPTTAGVHGPPPYASPPPPGVTCPLAPAVAP